MTDIIDRIESAVAQWKAGAITHSLHVELAELAQIFHVHLTEAQEAAPASLEPVQVIVPDKAPEA